MLSVEVDVKMSSKKKRAVKPSTDFSISNGQSSSSKDSEASNAKPRATNFTDAMPHLDSVKNDTDPVYNYSKYPHYNNYNILNYMHYQQQQYPPFSQSNPPHLQSIMQPFTTAPISKPNNTTSTSVAPSTDKSTDKLSDNTQSKKSSHHVATPMLSQLLQYPMVPKDSKVAEYEEGLKGSRPEWHPRTFLTRPTSGQDAITDNNINNMIKLSGPPILTANSDSPVLGAKELKSNDIRGDKTDKKLRGEGRGRKRGTKRHEGKSKRLKKEPRTQKLVSDHNVDDTMSDNSSSTEVYSQASCGSADESLSSDHGLHNQTPFDQRISPYSVRNPNFNLTSLRQGLNSPDHSRSQPLNMMQHPPRHHDSNTPAQYPPQPHQNLKDPYRMPFAYQNNTQNSNLPYQDNYQAPYYDSSFRMRNERPDMLSRNSMAQFERPSGGAAEPAYSNIRMEYPQTRPLNPTNDPYRYNYRNPYYLDQRFSDPRFSDPRFSDPKFMDPRFADHRSNDPRFMDPKFSDPRFSDSRFIDPRFSEMRFGDPRLRQLRPSEEMFRHSDGSRPAGGYKMNNHFAPTDARPTHQQQIIPNYRPYMQDNQALKASNSETGASNHVADKGDTVSKPIVEPDAVDPKDEKLKADESNASSGDQPPRINDNKVESKAPTEGVHIEKSQQYGPSYQPHGPHYIPPHAPHNMYPTHDFNYRPDHMPYHQMGNTQPHYRGYSPGYPQDVYRGGGMEGPMYEGYNGMGQYPRFQHNGQTQRYSENNMYRQHDLYTPYRPSYKDYGPANMAPGPNIGPSGLGGGVMREMEHGSGTGEVMRMRNPAFDQFSSSSPASTPGMEPQIRGSTAHDISHFRPANDTPEADPRPDSVLDASSSGGPMSLASSDSESLKGRCQSRGGGGLGSVRPTEQGALRPASNSLPPGKHEYFKHGTYSPATGHSNMMMSPRIGPRDDMISPSAVPSIHHSSRHGDNAIFVKICELGNEPERFYFLERLFDFMNQMETPINNLPMICKQTVDLYKLYQYVREKGGMMEVTKNKKWRDVSACLNHGASSSAGFTLKRNYAKYLFPFECRFDRGNIDPGPILATMELNFKKDSKKLLSGGLEDGSSRQYGPGGIRDISSPSHYAAQNQEGYQYQNEFQRPPYPPQGQYSDLYGYHGNRLQQPMGAYHRYNFPDPSSDAQHQKHSEIVDFNGGSQNYPSYYGAPSFQHTRSNYRPELTGSFGQPPKNMVFPYGLVESAKSKPLRKKKLNHKDIGLPVDMWRLFLALKSGLACESAWSFDVLAILLRDDATASNFYLANLPGLLELILDHFRVNISRIFERELSDLEITVDQKHLKTDNKLISDLKELELDRIFPSTKIPSLDSKFSVQFNSETNGDFPTKIENKDSDVCESFYSGIFDWQMGWGDSTDHITDLLSSNNTANFCRDKFFGRTVDYPIKNLAASVKNEADGLRDVVKTVESICEVPLTCLQIDAIRNLSFNGADSDDTLWSIKSVDNSRFHANVSPRRVEIAGRCQIISGILRNLSFIIGNDLEMCRHAGLLVFIGRLIMLQHRHSKRRPATTFKLSDLQLEDLETCTDDISVKLKSSEVNDKNNDDKILLCEEDKEINHKEPMPALIKSEFCVENDEAKKKKVPTATLRGYH